MDSCSVSIASRDPPAVLGRFVSLTTNILDRETIVDFLRRCVVDVGAGEKCSRLMPRHSLLEASHIQRLSVLRLHVTASQRNIVVCCGSQWDLQGVFSSRRQSRTGSSRMLPRVPSDPPGRARLNDSGTCEKFQNRVCRLN